MSDIDDIIQIEIIDKLTSISIDNGFNNDISVLDGYLVHYASDLLSGKNGLSFPAIAVQPMTDTPNPNSSKIISKNERTMRLIGAVSVKVPADVNSSLNSLLIDVRKAIAMDKFLDSLSSKASEIDFGQAVFNLPDSQDQYAFFEMDITIKYIENWK